MYLLDVASSFDKDVEEVVNYYLDDHGGEYAVRKLRENINRVFDILREFPKRKPFYYPSQKAVKAELRYIPVNRTYMILYNVDDADQTVTVVRLLNSRSDVDSAI